MYHLVSFSRFRLVPFLTELRAVMDWVWTDTTLSLSNWICVEDIYANIFILKCWRESEKVTQTITWYETLQNIHLDLFLSNLCLVLCLLLLYFSPEISTPSRTEEEEGGKIRNGRLPHLCSHQYHLVPTPLHVASPVCSWSGQSASGSVHPAQHSRIWGQEEEKKRCFQCLVDNIY